jgi:hypothetical protein
MTSNNHPTATFLTPHSNLSQSGRFGSEQVAAFIGMRTPAEEIVVCDPVPDKN